MAKIYANQFSEIPQTLQQNDELRNRTHSLVQAQPMPGKVLDGGDRLERFRAIMTRLVTGQIGVAAAIADTEAKLRREDSPHADNNQVFASGWAERQVRTQYSRFYNQAVLEELKEQGVETCFVPHSSEEKPTTACSTQLAGSNQSVDMLHGRLVEAYARGNWSSDVKIPNHPHCTHVVRPEA